MEVGKGTREIRTGHLRMVDPKVAKEEEDRVEAAWEWQEEEEEEDRVEAAWEWLLTVKK